MNFGTIMPFMMGGLKVRRKEFPEFVYHVENMDDVPTLISCNKTNGAQGVVEVIEISDIFATDWEVSEND